MRRMTSHQIKFLPAHEQTMTYVFDFGDWWEFDVTLEQIDPDMQIKKAVLLQAHGESPEQYPRWE